MPRRLLSVRSRKEENRPVFGVPEGFIFDFTPKPNDSRISPHALERTRPFTSGSDCQRKRKPDLTLLIERPQTSRDSQGEDTPQSIEPLDCTHIGMAFGSPRHPPQTFGPVDINMNASQSCFLEKTSPSRSPSVRKWKKIGGIFRHRSNPEKNSHPVHQPQHSIESHKLGLPIHRTLRHNPKSPQVRRNSFKKHIADSPQGQTRHATTRLDGCYAAGDFDKFMDARSIPSLQVKIPGSPFERYSVMFKNVNATPQHSTLGRRRDPMEKITPEPSPLDGSLDALGPRLKRRTASPTVSVTADTPPRAVSQDTNSVSYSLFPSTPNSSRPQSQHRPSPQSHPRPSAAPSQDMPSHDVYLLPPKAHGQIRTSRSSITSKSLIEKDLPCPVHPKGSDICHTSNHSRGSSAGEIFFDVKSFRDSKGQDANQYEMTRPPSAELQLARSKSNARKQKQRKPDALPPPPHEPEARAIKTTSVQIDETIALVKSLACTTALPAVETEERSKVLPQDSLIQDQEMNVIEPDDTDVPAMNKAKRKSAKLRSEGLNIDVPSPVLESIEEATPGELETRFSVPLATESASTGKLGHIASRACSNSTDLPNQQSRSLTSTPSPLPPAVPVKDSKYIPLSRYAPRHTAEDLVRQTGLRPVRPVRSNTDDFASYNNRPVSFRHHDSAGRSFTMPLLHHSPATKQGISPPIFVGSEESSPKGRDMPMMVAYVKPSAEVSIARTVSLSRKPSAKITVSRQPSKIGSRAAGQTQEDATEKQVPERLPVVQEVLSKHKPGLSQNAVLELVTMASEIPSMPATNESAKPVEMFPVSPPAVSV